MTEGEDRGARPARSGFVRWSLLALGVLFAALGFVGAFLPVLPTTPFLLLAIACFSRSSPTLHRRLLENRIFGPYLEQWRSERTVPVDAKRRAIATVVISFALSIALLDVTWVRVLLVAVGVGLLLFLARLPSAVERKPENTESDQS